MAKKNAKKIRRSRTKPPADLEARVTDLNEGDGTVAVELLAGHKEKHNAGRQGRRRGSEKGYVILGGKKVPIERPRERSDDGKKCQIERYRAFQKPVAMEASVETGVVCGVTTRDYQKVTDDVCDGYGIRKSSVSRHWKALSAQRPESPPRVQPARECSRSPPLSFGASAEWHP